MSWEPSLDFWDVLAVTGYQVGPQVLIFDDHHRQQPFFAGLDIIVYLLWMAGALVALNAISVRRCHGIGENAIAATCKIWFVSAHS